jgi:hypothetical protein
MIEEVTQQEKREVLRNDRRVREASTYHAAAQSNIDDERGGRYAHLGSPTTVTGSAPTSVHPMQPENSPWHRDPVPDEPSLGFSVDAMEPVGEPFERGPHLRQQRFRGTEVRNDTRTDCEAESRTNPQGEIAVEDL